MRKKTALITGASRGIGKAAALKFAASGYDLAILCRSRMEDLRQVQNLVLACGRDCLVFQGDVADAQFCRSVVAEVQARFRRIDVLVNNAGITQTGLLQELSDGDWNRILSVNLSSVFYFCKAVIPIMLSQGGGSIVNVSSVWGNNGASCEAAYSAAKGGINALTKALGKELAPSRIRVNALACGAIDTEMNAFLDADERAALMEEIPAGRMGSAAEAGDMILQIAESPHYLTGQVITFDGGWQ